MSHDVQNIRSRHGNLRSAEVTWNSRGRDRDGVPKTEISRDWRVHIVDLRPTYVHTNFLICHADCNQFWVATYNQADKKKAVAKNAVGLPKVRVLFQNALRGMEKSEFLPCKTEQPV